MGNSDSTVTCRSAKRGCEGFTCLYVKVGSAKESQVVQVSDKGLNPAEFADNLPFQVINSIMAEAASSKEVKSRQQLQELRDSLVGRYRKHGSLSMDLD